MPQQELLIKVVQALQNADIDHMVTGSIVSSLQGEPRSTHDIDVVVSARTRARNALYARQNSVILSNAWKYSVQRLSARARGRNAVHARQGSAIDGNAQ